MNTILVVEPDRNQRVLLKEELEFDGHTVCAVGSVPEALFAFVRQPIGLAVLDVGQVRWMPTDLFGLLYRLRRHIPVVVYTGYAPEDNRPVARLASAYVVKNSNLRELREAVQRVLGVRHTAPPLLLEPAAEAAAS